jgi:hypothetical protein
MTGFIFPMAWEKHSRLADRLEAHATAPLFLESKPDSTFTVVFFVPSLRAQEYLAAITGEVRNSSGAKVTNAEITATDEQTHFKKSGKTNGVGAYSIPFLPGSYTVQVNAPGFAPAERTNVVISAGDNKEVGFDLSINDTAEVTVSADKQVLDTGNANAARGPL